MSWFFFLFMAKLPMNWTRPRWAQVFKLQHPKDKRRCWRPQKCHSRHILMWGCFLSGPASAGPLLRPTASLHLPPHPLSPHHPLVSTHFCWWMSSFAANLFWVKPGHCCCLSATSVDAKNRDVSIWILYVRTWTHTGNACSNTIHITEKNTSFRGGLWSGLVLCISISTQE